MEALEERFRLDPQFKAEWDQRQNITNKIMSQGNGTSKVSTLTGPVTIPVIVHVVLPNPYMITETQIDALLARMNLDYAGTNADSTNGAAFYSVRGHSKIQFTRARRTPSGQLTTGIERRASTGVTVGTSTYQPVKHYTDGGLDPWPITDYYNLWVGDAGASGLLGIAPTIGVGAQTETTGSNIGIDGICVDYRGFSNGCFSYPQFALGRTVVHEVGHNFGLYHTFTGCAAGADFAQPSQTLPATLVGAAADDTPGLSASTSGCPSGTVLNGCTPNVGKMYQDYMDYTDDPCYSMFTKNQVARMEYILENYRSGYLTTLGATPPASVPAVDASPEMVVSPGGSEFISASCSNTSYPLPTCPGAFTPKVLVTNKGTSNLTSVTVTATLNGGTPVTATVNSLNLLTGYSTVVTLPGLSLVPGSNVIQFITSAPNGSTDQNIVNDTLIKTINLSSAITTTLPQTVGFEGAFPPAGWQIINPDNDETWTQNTPGHSSTNSMYFNNYDVNHPNENDDLASGLFNVNATDTVQLTFDVAYQYYPNPTYYDTLKVLVSTGACGTSNTVYSKGGPTLATVGACTGGCPAGYSNPTASAWRTDTVKVVAAATGQMSVLLRNVNRYGNNLYIDNVNLKIIPQVITAVTNINPDINSVVLMPNTIRSTATLRVSAIHAMKMSWSVLDAEGRTVKKFTQQVFAGQNDLNVDVRELANGAYQMIGNASNGKTTMLKFVKQ